MADDNKKKFQEAIQSINRTGKVSVSQPKAESKTPTSSSSTSKTGGNFFSNLIGALTNKEQIKQGMQSITQTGKVSPTSTPTTPTTPTKPTNSYVPAKQATEKTSEEKKPQTQPTSQNDGEIKNRSFFDNDKDYEYYLVDNKINVTQGDAFQYLKEKSKAEGTTSRAYLEGMRTRYKNAKETSNIAEKAKNGEYSESKLADINARYNTLIDENGDEVDLEKYSNDVELVNSTYDDINSKIEKLKNDYTAGKIDYQTMVSEYDRYNAMWNENANNAQRLNSYKQVSGFDYYNWMKSKGMDTTEFEAYAENLNDIWPERLAQAYAASWWDTASLRADMVGLVRSVIDKDYDIRSDDNVANEWKQTAEELKAYAFAGDTGFSKLTNQALSALMPMVNEMMIASVVPAEAVTRVMGAGGKALSTAETAQAVAKFVNTSTNINLGIQSGIETYKRRLDEGNDKMTALTNGTIHGVITAMIEGLDVGSTLSFISNGVANHVAGLAMIAKPSVVNNLLNMVAGGHGEGLEEVYESVGTNIADNIFNIVSDIGDSLGVDALQRVQVDPLNPQDLATEYALAFYGTALMGAPASVGNYLDTKQKYNAVLKARDHFESVLDTPQASEEEKRLAQISIENIDFALGTSPVANSELAQAVQKSGEDADSLPTYTELLNDLANAYKGDIREEAERTRQTIEQSNMLRTMLQESLNERGINTTAEEFMDANDKTRREMLESSPIFTEAGMDNLYTRMRAGVNGANVGGVAFINTNQDVTLDLDAVIDMDRNEFDTKVDQDADLIYQEAGEDATLTTSSFHEWGHFAEGTEAYERLKEDAINDMGKDRFEEAKYRVGKIYEKLGIPVDDIETEVLAFYFQKNFNNKKFLSRMARYNTSFIDRIFSNLFATLKGDKKTKMENTYLDAIREAQAVRKQQLAPQYSVGSLFQAIGMTIHKESETVSDDGGVIGTRFYATDENGNIIREVTKDMVKNSPLGQMLKEAEVRGFVESSDSQSEMVATIYNSILKSQDPEMFWAIFGSIGFTRARVGTSSWDESQSKKFASFTGNSDPQYGHTFDVTTICTKTQQLIDVASETMKRLGRGLTKDEVIDVVYNEVFKAGEPVPCPVCYVFSRWVGVGGVLDDMKKFQDKYRNADVNEIKARYETLSKEVDRIAKERGIRSSKALSDLRKQTDKEVTRRYDELFKKEIVEEMGGDKLSVQEKAEFESLKKDLEILNDWSWINNVILNDKTENGVRTIEINEDYLEKGDVPEDILFDLNRGEDFSKYPAWRYRASRGQSYGKIIAPYSDMVLGQTVLGFASPSSLSDLGKRRSPETNPFLDMNNVEEQQAKYDDAVYNAKVQNLKNGSRAQSTSDFRFEYITDYILHFLQLQSIGSCGQTYTKVPEAVPVLCSVGYEVNMSLMPKGKGYKPAKEGDPYAYYVEGIEGTEDGWYTIDCSSVTGINPDSAFYLREQYDNAQTIMVGINAVHMYLCMQDPRIDFIIPYHASGGSDARYNSMMTTVGENEDLGPNDRIDYAEASNENEVRLKVLTENQNRAYELRDKILTNNLQNPTEEEINFMKGVNGDRNALGYNEEGTGILWDLWNRFYVEGVDSRCRIDGKPLEMPWDGSGKNKYHAIYPYEYWDETSIRDNAQVNGMRYISYCKELGYQPKFENLSNGDGSGGYWKVLPDRSMYNVDGTSHIQKPINMDNFSSDFLFKGKIQEGIVQPIAEQMNIPIDENNPEYQQLRKNVLSQQFNKSATEGIVQNVLKRIEDGDIKVQFSASGIGGLGNLINSKDKKLRFRGEVLIRALSEAKKLETEGKSVDDIWRETGWVRKDDGQWRYQFYDGAEDTMIALSAFLDELSEDANDDNQNHVKLKDVFGQTYRLTDFIDDNNVLFAMYPKLKETRVSFLAEPKDAGAGFYDAREDVIGINLGVWAVDEQSLISNTDPSEYVFDLSGNNENELFEDFFHELQHAIQFQEKGFEVGSDPNVEKEYRDITDDTEATVSYLYNLGEIEASEEAENAVNRSEWERTPTTYGTLLGKYGREAFGKPKNIQFSGSPKIRDSGDAVPPTRVVGEVTDGYGETKQMEFATSNIPKSQIFSEEQQERTRQDIEDHIYDYISSHNDVEVQRAREWMERDGIDETYNSYMQNDHPDMKTVVQGTVLLEALTRAKDPRWHDVAVKMASDANFAGKFLQAYSIMQRLMPDGQLTALRRNMRRMQQQLNNKYGNQAPQLQLNEELEQKLREAETPEAREEVREEILRDLQKQVPLTFRDRLNSWRYLAMLGNPRTHVRNILGNAVNIPAVTMKNIIGTFLERTANAKFKEKYGMKQNSKAILNRFSAEDKALLDKGKSEYQLYKMAIEKNQQKYERKSFSDNNPIGRGLNRLANWNSKAMDTEDFWFTSARFSSSYAQYVKSNGMTADTVTPEINAKAVAYAIRESLRATYRDANAVADWLNELEYSNKDGLRMASYIKDALIPFTKTPMNIVKRGVRYSPIGLVYTLTHDYWGDLKKGKITANDFLDNLAQGLTGTGIAVLGAWLASLGLFRTKDDDKDRKQYFDSENGEQDYALDFREHGGGTYTIDWATPVIMPFAIGAELWNIFKDFEGTDLVEDGWSAINAVADISAKVMDPIMETSMLSSMQDALKSYSSSGGAWLGEMVMSMTSNYVQQMFPTWGGQLARTIDGTRRTTYPNNGKLDKMFKQIANKIPFLSQINEPYINRKGQEEQSEDMGMGFVGRAFLNMISPGYYSSKDLDEYDEEIYRLYDSTGELDAFPSNSSISVTFEKEKFNFSEEEYTEWHKTRWQTEDLYVNQFIDSQSYKGLSDEERIKTIADIRGYAQKVAKRQFLESKGYVFVDSKEEYEERSANGEKVVYEKDLVNATGAIDNGIALYAYYDYLNNGGSKQAEKMAYLEASGLSDEQKEYLWNLSGYKTSYLDFYRKQFGSSKKGGSSSKSKKLKSASAGTKTGGLGIRSSKKGINTSKTSTTDSATKNMNVGTFKKAYSSTMSQATSRGAGLTRGASNGSVVCPKCGNRVSAGMSRCPICGTRL